MKWSCHNSETPFFAESGWPKLSLLRDTYQESTKRGLRIGAIATSPGIRAVVNLLSSPLVVTMTRPQVKIAVTQTSVTSLKSQGRDEHD